MIVAEPESMECFRTDTELVQVLVVIYAVPLVVRTFPAGEVTWSAELASRTKEKSDALTVIEAITELLEPDTLRVTPLTERTVSVVRVTSLYAAKLTAGAATRRQSAMSNDFCMICYY